LTQVFSTLFLGGGCRPPARACEVFETFRGQRLADTLVTTSYVISETIALVRTAPPRRHADAVKVGEVLFGERLARVYRVSAEEERAGFEYFKRHQDKEYSFVDCVSFTLMDKLGIQEALAIDADFTHRFVAHPGPRERR
jgi:uncharacterized protein